MEHHIGTTEASRRVSPTFESSSSTSHKTSKTAEFLLQRWASADHDQSKPSHNMAAIENTRSSHVRRTLTKHSRPEPIPSNVFDENRTAGNRENVSVNRTRKFSERRRALVSSIRHHDSIVQQSGVAKTDIHDSPTSSPPIVIPQEADFDNWSFASRGTNFRNFVDILTGCIPGCSLLRVGRTKLYIVSVAMVVLCILVTLSVVGGVKAVNNRKSSSASVGATYESNAGLQNKSGAQVRHGDIDSKAVATHASYNLRHRDHQVLSENLGANLVDVSSRQLNGKELPFFFNIPGAGGITMQRVTRQCASLLEASEAGRGHEKESYLVVHEAPIGSGNRFVNVDTSTFDGIKRARDLNLVRSDIVQVFYSPLVQDLSAIFTPVYRGQMFGLFRHPVQRAIHSYNSLANGAAAESQLTLFAMNGELDNNHVTRLLVGKEKGELTESDLELAKETLRLKCVVGLAEEMKESILRFSKYFSWGLAAPDKNKCLDRLINLDSREIPSDFVVAEGSELWTLIMKENDMDIKLYDYALELFEEQRNMFT